MTTKQKEKLNSVIGYIDGLLHVEKMQDFNKEGMVSVLKNVKVLLERFYEDFEDQESTSLKNSQVQLSDEVNKTIEDLKREIGNFEIWKDSKTIDHYFERRVLKAVQNFLNTLDKQTIQENPTSCISENTRKEKEMLKTIIYLHDCGYHDKDQDSFYYKSYVGDFIESCKEKL